jgi:precorrin-2 dehydrogenase/sirohydrochlorin ferrochelatase
VSAKASGWIPLWVRVRGFKCLVVGGGQVALRKIRMLLETGASVEVVTKKACPQVEEMAQGGLVQLRIKEVDQQDLRGARLVVVATDKREVNRSVSNWAQDQGVLCNVVDEPELCSAVFPAIFRKGKLEVAVSTGGASPTMAARLRDQIGDSLQPGYEVLLELLSEMRGRIKEMGFSEEKRLVLLRSLVDEEVMKACVNAKEKDIRAILETRLQEAFEEQYNSKQNHAAASCACGPEIGDKSF